MKAVRVDKAPHELDVGEWCHSSPDAPPTRSDGSTGHGFIIGGQWLDEHKRPLA